MTTYYGSWDVYSLNYDNTSNKISLGTSQGTLLSGAGLDNSQAGDTNTVTSASGQSLGSVSQGGSSINGDTYVGTISADGQTLYIITDGAGDYFAVVAAGANLKAGFGPTLVPSSGPTWNLQCFAEGTLIATPDGERAVESLAQGDLVLTADGVAKPVRWLGRSTQRRPFADPARALPVRIKAGALGENLPVRDLLVSPGHAMLVDGMLVHAGAMVNGSSITVERQGPETFTLYHVETDAHDVLVAEGAPTESFLLGVEDLHFDNLGERPDGLTPAEMNLPRVKSARQLPAALREKLAVRAAAIAPALTA